MPSTYLKPYSESSKEDADDPSIISSDPNKEKNSFQTNNIQNFSSSLLKNLQDDSYNMTAYLYPKLSSSGLFFVDLHWDNLNKTLKPKIVKCQRVITLVECRFVPLIKTDMAILNCHIRMCLHDGNKILSNIHTVSSKFDSKEPQNWSFISSISQYLEDNKIFIRTNNSSATLGLLLQLCVSYKMPKSIEKKELSCGWSFMRLLDDSGIAVPNKSKILHIHEGNPFKGGVNSMALIERNILKTFISKNRQPRLILRLGFPDKDLKHHLDFLPDTLIGPCSLIFMISLYRHSLADHLLQQTITVINTELEHCPVESTFPKLFEQPDILNVFRKELLEQMKIEKKSIKKDIKRMKKLFQQVYKETAYFLLNCNIFPLYSFDDISTHQERLKEIERLMLIRQTKGPLGLAISQNISHKPFCINELALDITGKHCLSAL